MRFHDPRVVSREPAVPVRRPSPAHAGRGVVALVAAAAALLLTGTVTAPADADTPSRVTLPDPNLGPAPSGGIAANAALTIPWRVYLTEQNPKREAASGRASPRLRAHPDQPGSPPEVVAHTGRTRTVSRDLGLHLMRFVMMEHLLPPEEVLTFLQNLADTLAALTAQLKQYAAAADVLGRHPRLALDHGIAIHCASLRWAEQTVAALSADPRCPPAIDVRPSRLRSTTVTTPRSCRCSPTWPTGLSPTCHLGRFPPTRPGWPAPPSRTTCYARRRVPGQPHLRQSQGRHPAPRPHQRRCPHRTPWPRPHHPAPARALAPRDRMDQPLRDRLRAVRPA